MMMSVLNAKIISIIVVCVALFAFLIGFFIIYNEMKCNRDDVDVDNVNDTTEMIINSTEIEDFGGPRPAIVISAPPICKDGERLELKTNTCRKKY
jgi:hypothetical protein